jgi:hypothetical protein
MATQAQIDAVTAEIVSGLDIAGSAAGVIDPELLPFIVIGKAAAAAIPGLVDDVTNLINGAAPSPADNLALATKIATLANPAAL